MYSQYRPQMDHTQYPENGGRRRSRPLSSYLLWSICGLYCRLYMAYVQLLYGPCMAYVWPTYGTYIGHMRVWWSVQYWPCMVMSGAGDLCLWSVELHGTVGLLSRQSRRVVFGTNFRVVGVTGMIEPKIGPKMIKKLIIKWDQGSVWDVWSMNPR